MGKMYFIKRSGIFAAILVLLVACNHELPNLTGTWSGEATAISDVEGQVSGEKKITIEQFTKYSFHMIVTIHQSIS